MNAFQSVADMRGRVTPSDADAAVGAKAAFDKQQSSMMYLESLGTALRYWTGIPDLDWSATQNPVMPGGTHGVSRGGANIMAISNQSRNLEGAWAFMKYTLSAEWERQRIAHGFVPVQKKYAVSPQVLFRKEPPYDLTDLIMAQARAYPMVIGWSEFNNTITAAFKRVWSGQMSARVALEQAVPVAEAALRAAQAK